jgi:phosphoribosylaminoimidazole-succinocarboxamide synthase
MMQVRHRYSGKVRELYETDDDLLLFVASDRVSAFDVVMAEPVPDKGRVLTALTVFWASLLADLAPTHLVSVVTTDPGIEGLTDLVGRALIVKPAEMLPLECIVRGYVSGSAWKEYCTRGTIHGMAVPSGLPESSALAEPMFTPSTKAAEGHDENISFDAAVDLVGFETANAARELSLAAYARGAAWAAERGIIIADTKFELGWIDGELAICDEILTPDSSRFWPADQWAPGTTPPALDKQPLRDWLEATAWDKTPPPPPLPPEVVEAMRQRYIEAYERLTGTKWS